MANKKKTDDEIGERIESLLEQARKVVDTNIEFLNRMVKPDGAQSSRQLTVDDWAISTWKYGADMAEHGLKAAALMTDYARETVKEIRSG